MTQHNRRLNNKFLLSFLALTFTSSPHTLFVTSTRSLAHAQDIIDSQHHPQNVELNAEIDPNDKIEARHAVNQRERNATNPRKRPNFTMSPSAAPSTAPSNAPSSSPSGSPSETPLCQLDVNGMYGTMGQSGNSIVLPISYSYEQAITGETDIAASLQSVEESIGRELVSSFWNECADDTTPTTRHNMRIRHLEHDITAEEFILELSTQPQDNNSSILGLSIHPKDTIDSTPCQELPMELCIRILGQLTLYTTWTSPAESTAIHRRVLSSIQDTLSQSNLHYLETDLPSIPPSLEFEFEPIEPIISQQLRSTTPTKKEGVATKWIVAPAAAIGAVVLALFMRHRRQQGGSTIDDGTSVSSYPSWFRNWGEL